jgi:hypothetical protein
MRADQLTDPVAYHEEGPVWSPGWAACAGSTCGRHPGPDRQRVARRHVGRIAAAQLLVQFQGMFAEYERYAELGIVFVMPTAR